jgi:S1-C subfamily serine protease
MKKILTVGALLFGVTTLVYAASVNKMIEKAKSQTVLISVEGFLGGIRGSGVLIDPTHVLTCFHMINDGRQEFHIYTYPLGKVIKAHAESGDKYNDLAILVLESSAPFKSKPVFTEKHNDGEHIYIIGNALGSMHWYVTSGILSGEEMGFLLTDATMHHGNSGGPWINDKGEIVGLSDWGLENKQQSVIGVNGAVSSKVINEFFKALEAQKKFQKMMKAMMGQ